LTRRTKPSSRWTKTSFRWTRPSINNECTPWA
jgi:hypothetical protein